MKNLILIGGPMGVGKTATCRELQKILPKNVFLDGDWCWDARPFIVTDETKRMVERNIAFLLNSFLRCSEYENVIFCWVMHQQFILDNLLANLDLTDVRVQNFSLIADEKSLAGRIERDIAAGVRQQGSVERSLAYLPLYGALNTRKIDVSRITAAQAAKTIAAAIELG